MKLYSERIKQLRKERKLSQDQLAALLGKSRSAVSMYETGQREPDFETFEAIADFFNIDLDYLMGRSNIARKSDSSASIPAGFERLPEMTQVPLIGSIACGTPILAEQNIEQHIGVPATWRADFALTCRGDSMAPTIQDGDIVCIRIQPEVGPHDIAAIRIGAEATLKHFQHQGDMVILTADNPAVCGPMVYTGQELEDIAIEGKAVGICRGM